MSTMRTSWIRVISKILLRPMCRNSIQKIYGAQRDEQRDKMNQEEYDALMDEYVNLERLTFTKEFRMRNRRPPHIPFGVSWTTKEVSDIAKRMDEIVDAISYHAKRQFFLDIEEKYGRYFWKPED